MRWGLLFLLLLAPPVAAQELEKILQAKPFLPPVTSGRFQVFYYAGGETLDLRDREKALARVEEFFGRQLAGPVKLLVYPNYDEAAPFPCGRTTPDERLVHIALQPGYWAYERHNPGHELTHLLAMTNPAGEKVWAVPLLNEGLAEYLCGLHIDPHLRLTDYLGKPTRVCVDTSNLYRGDLYHVGGSFVKFLVENYPDGRRKVLQLLEETRPIGWDDEPYFPEFMAKLERIFETDYQTMMADWNRVLEPYFQTSYVPRPEDRAALEGMLGPLKSVRYYSFPRFLSLICTVPNGKRVVVEATPEGGWKEVRRR